MSDVPGFWRWAADHPDDLATIDVDGTTSTYGELGDRVDRTSRWLQSIGIGRDAPMALVAGNSVGFLATTLAAAQIGARYTLVNRHLAPPEVDYIVRDCGARLVVTDAALAPTVAGVVPGVRYVALDDAPGVEPLADRLAEQEAGPPPERTAGSIMLYTSGTSGRPKGVQSTAATATPEEAADRAAYVLRRFGLDPGAEVGAGVHLVTSPLYHSAPIANATVALHLGHVVVVTPRFDAAGSLALIERHGVTWTHVVPTMMKRWLEVPDRGAVDVSSMRWLIHAAAPCPPVVKRGIIEWFGPIVLEYYSSTEVGGTSITSEEWLAHPGSVGRPWAGADVKVLDDDGAPVEPGTVGHIWMRNVRPFVYHNDPDKTAANRQGDYVTVGDLGTLDADGFLYLADRRTDLILSGGVNVYPAEVEAALLAHPGVADAAVVGLPDADLGEVVVAFVRPVGDGDGLVDALHAHCAAELARFKQPRRIELRDTLPRSETGKLLRRVLRDELAAG